MSKFDFVWINNQLYRSGSKKPLATIEPDLLAYPNMWRVKMPDGRISDLTNKVRAMDTAIAAAMKDLNK
jgi:hypothetical protein